MSTLQTARALTKNTGRFVIGFGYYNSPTIDEEIGKSSGTKTTLSFPYFELGGRFGLLKDLEVGAKVTLPGFLTVDGKVEVFSSEGLAVAGGLGLSYLGLSASSTSTSTTSFNAQFIDVLVPGYFSYDFTEWLALYTSPRYIFRYANASGGSGTAHLAGSSVGFKIGDKGGVFVEASYLKSLTSTPFDQWQANVALFFGLASNQ